MGGQWSCLKAQDFTEKHGVCMKDASYIHTQMRTAAVLIPPMVVTSAGSAGSARNTLAEKVKNKLKSTFTSRCLTVHLLKMWLLQKSSFN